MNTYCSSKCWLWVIKERKKNNTTAISQTPPSQSWLQYWLFQIITYPISLLPEWLAKDTHQAHRKLLLLERRKDQPTIIAYTHRMLTVRYMLFKLFRSLFLINRHQLLWGLWTFSSSWGTWSRALISTWTQPRLQPVTALEPCIGAASLYITAEDWRIFACQWGPVQDRWLPPSSLSLPVLSLICHHFISIDSNQGSHNIIPRWGLWEVENLGKREIDHFLYMVNILYKILLKKKKNKDNSRHYSLLRQETVLPPFPSSIPPPHPSSFPFPTSLSPSLHSSLPPILSFILRHLKL